LERRKLSWRDDCPFDNDENGTIDYVEGTIVNHPTDGDLAIQVFGSRDEAEQAYNHTFSSERGY